MTNSYDVAQICRNGHVANHSSIDFPQFNKKFCDECGELTITECPKCQSPIRGSYREGMGWTEYKLPHFCINCGNPFPWTEAKLEAAHELAREIDILSEEERAILEKSINDLVTNSPSTTVAATKYKKIMLKVGQTTASMFREILTDVLSETAKKILFP